MTRMTMAALPMVAETEGASAGVVSTRSARRMLSGA